jgi:hypothetical protein
MAQFFKQRLSQSSFVEASRRRLKNPKFGQIGMGVSRQRMDELEPIVWLLLAAAGRKLRVAEIRLLETLDARETATYARMVQDVSAVWRQRVTRNHTLMARDLTIGKKKQRGSKTPRCWVQRKNSA